MARQATASKCPRMAGLVIAITALSVHANSPSPPAFWTSDEATTLAQTDGSHRMLWQHR